LNCKAHCRSCGRHFTSTSAFDRHRTGPWDDRSCADPSSVDRLYEYEGECDLKRGDPDPEAAVWSTKKPG